MAKDHLEIFLHAFRSSFHPPKPKYRPGKDWLVSGVWSHYMRAWLKNQSFAHLEFPHTRSCDAWLWVNSKAGRMEIALKWKWDDSKVHKEFPEGDFKKVLEVDALSALAIVQTRGDGREGGRRAEQAEQTVARIRQSRLKNKIDNRPVGLMEIRRTFQDRSRVEFVWRFHNLNQGKTVEGERWAYQH